MDVSRQNLIKFAETARFKEKQIQPFLTCILRKDFNRIAWYLLLAESFSLSL